jgi:hypothetical protein
MNMKSNPPKASADPVVKNIRGATKRHYSTEDNIRKVNRSGYLGGQLV